MTTQESKEERRAKIEQLKEAVDAEQLLTALGFEIYKRSSKEIRCTCKLHGGDNKSAFRMDRVTKNWICFSHGCHEEIGFDVISLVKHVLNLSFTNAIKYLENMAGTNIHDESAYVEFKRANERRKFIDRMVDNRQVPAALLTEDYLGYFKKFRSNYFEQEKNGGFPKEVLDLFEIGGGYIDKYGFQRDVIPIRNTDGVLKAYSCRDTTGKADEDFKYLLTKDFDKDKVLYNLHRAKNFVGESKTLIVVEGFKSVWKLYMAGYKNAVACMGRKITSGQQSLLYTYAFNVVLLFDMDDAGVTGTRKALEEMRGKINMKPLFLPYEDGDPADLPIMELQQIIGGL